MKDLKIDIVSREPDVIIIPEVIPKAQAQPIARARIKLKGYREVVNFDPDCVQGPAVAMVHTKVRSISHLPNVFLELLNETITSIIVSFNNSEKYVR